MTDTRLFNCCTDEVAPDWSQFKSLETSGCIMQDDCTESGIADDKADFWTVYARHHSGEAEAITDCRTRVEVDAVAAELAKLSGLEVTPC